MSKEEKIEKIEKVTTCVLIVIVLLLYFLKLYNTQLVAILLLGIEIYTLIKYRKNTFLFFIFVCMLYFDYSFIVSKYLGTTPTLEIAYRQIKYESTLYIGIASVFIFHAVKLLFLKRSSYKEEKEDIKEEKDKNNNIILIFLTVCIAVILIDYLFFGFLSLSRTIYEYLIILFVIAFYYAKDNKIMRRILFILMMISTAVNMINGGRIISLQPLIAYFFINYSKKINYKKMLIVVCMGVIVFTIFGLYGDCIEYGGNFKDFNLTKIIDTFKLRKASLDTSVSAYWTGLTFIEMTNKTPVIERLKNFAQYMTIYTIGGTGTGYNQIYNLSREHYIHYFGGYITSYFYYWAGWIGVILISVFVGKQIQIINNTNENISEFMKIYIIYFISTLPRWYLYYPTSLIRGTLILFVVYKVLIFAKDNLIKLKQKQEEKLKTTKNQKNRG